MCNMGKKVLLLLLYLYSLIRTRGQLLSTPLYPVEDLTEVEGVEGGTAKLPCDLFPLEKDDKINLILWYKNEEKDPFYSYDARLAVFSSERHHLKESLLKNRVTFSPSPGPPIPHRLILKRLQQVDAGRYTCRVDFTMAQSSSRGVLLKVVTPVNSLHILDSQGRQMPSVLDPIPEGGTLNITCTAKGGRPQPSVSWWVDEAMIDDSWTEVAKGIVSNNLVINPLTRAHAHAVLTCRAAPSLVAIKTATITIDMYLRPESVEISAAGTSGTIRAGDFLDLTCTAMGSRPAPIIVWYKGSEIIPAKKSSSTRMPGVSTMSHTRVKIDKEDDGSRITCRVTNPSLPHHSLQEHITLNVTYPPNVELRMGSNLEGTVVKESSDLYLTCHVDANPDPHTVSFTHQGVVVQQNVKRGIVISGRDLVLRGIKRSQSGVYTCRAVNTQGTGISPPVNISVLYAPVCQHAPDVWAEPGTDVTATCSVSSSPADNIHFSWVWVTPTYSRRIMPGSVKVKGLTSNVTFTIPQDNGSISELGPRNKLGTLQCWARNDVGRQADPCTVDVRKPTPPSAPINCSLTGLGRERVRVTCQPGDTRTMPQTYQLQIYDAKTRKLHINVTSPVPSFLVPNLTAGRDYTVYVSSHTSYGGSPFKLVEAFNFKTAENRMREDEAEPMSWMTIIIFVSSVGGVILLILFVTTLIRLRLRRSQHKCTVRRTPSATEPKLADKNLYLDTPPEVPPSSSEKKFDTEEPSSQTGNVSPQKSPRDPTNPPPIIRQPSTRLPPIIKENGRAEPVRSTQPRTVLFVEPPKKRPEITVHKEDPPGPRSAYDSLYPGRRSAALGSKGLNGDVRNSLYPPSRSAYPESHPSYLGGDSKFRSAISNDVPEPDVYDTQFSSGSSNTLSRESGYCSPRHPPIGSTYRTPSSSVLGPHSNPSSAIIQRETRDPAHVFTFPSHGRDSLYEAPHPPPPLVRSSSSPPLPRPSIMKKSPSVSGSIYRRHEHPRTEGSTYRSLPRPNKSRHNEHDSDLVRYRSLDRRFDIPFTGSLPRPQTRRGSRSDRRLDYSDSRFDFRAETTRLSDTKLDKSDSLYDNRSEGRYDSRTSVRSLRDTSIPQRRSSGSSRLRFSSEKYFHVYSDKDKHPNCEDEVDENFV